MDNKKEPVDHQQQHNMQHIALKVQVVRDDYDHLEAFLDADTVKCRKGVRSIPPTYNLYGQHRGASHADRLLDDYLMRERLGVELKECSCSEYRDYLRNEEMYGVKHPHLSMRARLAKIV